MFGPSALATPANAVTVVRLLGAPILVALIAIRGVAWSSVIAWVLLAGTDGVDGWIARRHGTTRSGAFLDPLADKVLLLCALVTLTAINVLWWVPVALISVREIWMSLYRARAGGRGVSVPARTSAKLKTLAQDTAVALALFPPVSLHHHRAVIWVLWVAVALTVFTGLQYMADARRTAS
ncbi:MAG: CDP-alcohol phosphatidyltransferase family protein [Acidimicrobiales bacterium]